MDLQVPEGPIRSLKDFLLHIFTVTIGILIALGLEQAVESHHRAKLAHDAVEAFRKELADDRQEMDAEVADMPHTREKIAAEIANLEDPHPRPIDYPGIHYNVMSTASWDAAVATQALNELPYDTVHGFAQAYGLLRLFDDIGRKGLEQWQQLHSYGDDPAKMTAEQRRTLIEKLRSYENFAHVIEDIGKNNADLYDKALKQR